LILSVVLQNCWKMYSWVANYHFIHIFMTLPLQLMHIIWLFIVCHWWRQVVSFGHNVSLFHWHPKSKKILSCIFTSFLFICLFRLVFCISKMFSVNLEPEKLLEIFPNVLQHHINKWKNLSLQDKSSFTSKIQLLIIKKIKINYFSLIYY